MKRLLMALVVTGISVATGRADPGGFTLPGGAMAGYQPSPSQGEFGAPGMMGQSAPTAGKNPDRYGLLPGLRKAFRAGDTCPTCGGKGGHCSWCHQGKAPRGGHGGSGYAGYEQPAYPPVMQGTLVFPHHPYVRSPRDFFMYEPAP